MSQQLAGRIALVTGSTSGIGRGIAGALAADGAHVIVTGRREALGRAAVDEIRAAGGAATYIGADLGGGAAAVEQFTTAVLDAAEAASTDGARRVDILVNNAAYLVGGAPTVGTDPAVIDAALAVNVAVPFLVTAALVPAMIDHGSGVVINVGSINGVTGMKGAALYGATKSAIHSLTKSWAAEFGPLGVRVNTIAPGLTEVEWSVPIRGFLDQLVAGVPSGRLSKVAEIGAVAVFLAGDAATNIHGATIPVDGGMASIFGAVR
ncbi:MAG: short-chain dehydrogenase/reductase [Ilumatobacteraceae bacterium]|nr:short-chain dehydrogenase/reductase [Ilumatobacteraceae bacterium]